MAVRMNDFVFIKHLEQCLTQSKWTVSIKKKILTLILRKMRNQQPDEEPGF